MKPPPIRTAQTHRCMLIVSILLAGFLLAGCSQGRQPAAPSPSPVPANATRLASLQVSVQPEGATVRVNGEIQGETPIVIALPAGTYSISVEKEGYAALNQEVFLPQGREGMLSGVLSDITPPDIVLTVPKSEVRSDETLLITVQTRDNDTVSQIQILEGERLIAEGHGEALSVEWHPTDEGDSIPGERRIRVRALDQSGNLAEREATITVLDTPSSSDTTDGVPLPTPTVATIPSPTATVTVFVTSLVIPTYPYQEFVQTRINEALNVPYDYFDQEAYDLAQPTPVHLTYEVVVLENDYLRLTMLPDLGGRIYEVIFKPTGHNEFYRNPVIKPSPWGPTEINGGWLAAGGMEWGFPVEEHGYEWGHRWGYITIPNGDEVTVTLFNGGRDQRLRVAVDVTLAAGEARFTVHPRIENPTTYPVAFKFWLAAMLAPGEANRPSPDLHFIFPTKEVTLHDTDDPTLPSPGEGLSWPIFKERDLSRLGNWQGYMGFFARPSAQSDFTGVYGKAEDEGIMRIYPSAIAPGLKGFSFGWSDEQIPFEKYTDDNSGYVELHGGIAPTFWDKVTLESGEAIEWSETWYPIAGIGDVTFANENIALHLRPQAGGLQVGLYPTAVVSGRLTITIEGSEWYDEWMTMSPESPFNRIIPLQPDHPERGHVSITLAVPDAQPLLNHSTVVEFN